MPRAGTTGGNKAAGRKRFVAVDTLGLVWALLVMSADTPDRAGGPKLMERLRAAMSKLFREEPDTRQLVKLRAIYELLEQLTDACKHAAAEVQALALR